MSENGTNSIEVLNAFIGVLSNNTIKTKYTFLLIIEYN